MDLDDPRLLCPDAAGRRAGRRAGPGVLGARLRSVRAAGRGRLRGRPAGPRPSRARGGGPGRGLRRRARCAAPSAASTRSCARAGSDIPRCRAAPPPPGPQSRIDLGGAARALAAELGAIVDPGKRVCEALDRRRALPGDARRLARGPVARRARCAEAAEQRPDPVNRRLRGLPRRAGSSRGRLWTRAAIPVRALLDRLLAGFGERYEQAKRAGVGGRLRRPRAARGATCCAITRSCAASTPSASSGSWSTSCRTPTGCSSS